MRKELLKNAAAPLRKHGRFENLLRITRASRQGRVDAVPGGNSPRYVFTMVGRRAVSERPIACATRQRSSTCIASMSCGSWLNR